MHRRIPVHLPVSHLRNVTVRSTLILIFSIGFLFLMLSCELGIFPEPAEDAQDSEMTITIPVFSTVAQQRAIHLQGQELDDKSNFIFLPPILSWDTVTLSPRTREISFTIFDSTIPCALTIESDHVVLEGANDDMYLHMRLYADGSFTYLGRGIIECLQHEFDAMGQPLDTYATAPYTILFEVESEGEISGDFMSGESAMLAYFSKPAGSDWQYDGGSAGSYMTASTRYYPGQTCPRLYAFQLGDSGNAAQLYVDPANLSLADWPQYAQLISSYFTDHPSAVYTASPNSDAWPGMYFDLIDGKWGQSTNQSEE